MIALQHLSYSDNLYRTRDIHLFFFLRKYLVKQRKQSAVWPTCLEQEFRKLVVTHEVSNTCGLHYRISFQNAICQICFSFFFLSKHVIRLPTDGPRNRVDILCMTKISLSHNISKLSVYWLTRWINNLHKIYI